MTSNNNYNQYFQPPVSTAQTPQQYQYPTGSTAGSVPYHTGVPPAQTQQGAPPAQVQLPTMIMPTDAQFAESARNAEHESAGYPNRFKFPPPVGKNNWSQAPVQANRSIRIWLCPGYEAGRPLDHLQYSHFLMTPSHPRGVVVRCDDASKCLLCQAYDANKDHVSKQFFDSTLRFCKRNKERLYNILTLDDETMMAGKEGVLRPLVANFANYQVNGGITEGLKRFGATALHPQHGRPWKLTRTKTGPASVNVMTTIEPMEPAPLPQHLWSLLSPDNLWKLHAISGSSDERKQAKMLQELKIPLQGVYEPPQQAPMGWQGGPPQTYTQPPPTYAPQHHQYAPPPQPHQYAPPHQQQQQQSQAPWAQQPPPGQPHPLDQMPAWDQPQQPPPTYVPPQAPAPSSPPQLRAPLAGDVQLPDDRQRCFGQHDPGSNFCKSCPDWVKSQCVPQSPPPNQASNPTMYQPPAQAAPSNAPSDAQLAQLQQQLAAMGGGK